MLQGVHQPLLCSQQATQALKQHTPAAAAAAEAEAEAAVQSIGGGNQQPY
jgi:hypothetical protein